MDLPKGLQDLLAVTSTEHNHGNTVAAANGERHNGTYIHDVDTGLPIGERVVGQAAVEYTAQIISFPNRTAE